MLEFRIIDQPRQRFSVIMNNRRVTFDLWYNQSSDRWSFDLSLDDTPVIHGRRIVAGADLLAPFNLGLGILVAFSETGAEPTRNNLPQGYIRLYHTTQEEVDAALAA